MAKAVFEPLNGGVVQVRHPTLLQRGELQDATDMLVKPGDPRLHKAPGRTVYGTARSTSVSCTTNGTTALTSSAAFGTDIASVALTVGSMILVKAGAFAAITVGQTVVGTGIPSGSLVRRVIDNDNVEINKPVTSTGTVTVTFSDFHPGTFISGTGITTGTYISSITSASALTMSAAASDSTTTSRTFSEAVSGLRALGFDDNLDDILLAKAADKVYASTLTTTTGTFSTLFTGLSQDGDAILEAIQYGNRHIILTGFDIPRVVFYKDNGSGVQAITGRALGMKPVTAMGGLSLVSGSFPSLSDFQNGWYYFLVTEMLNPGTVTEDGPETSESTFDGTPLGIYLSDYTTQGVQVTRGISGGTTDFVNNGLYGANTATHWAIYMAPKQSDEFPIPDLSTFRRVAIVPIGTAAATLKDTNPYQAGFAAAIANVASFDPMFPGGSSGALSTVAAQSVASCTYATSSQTITSAGGFSTVTAGMVLTDANNHFPYGTIVTNKIDSSTITVSNFPTTSATNTLYFGNKPSWDNQASYAGPNGSTYRAADFYNFGIQNQGGFTSGTVTGVRVEINGSWLADNDRGDDRGFYIQLVKGNFASPTAISAERWISFKQGSYRAGVMSMGDQFDTWGVSWTPSDFLNGTTTFAVRLRKHASAVAQTHEIDGVKVIVYEGGNSLNLDGPPFKTVIISDQLGHSFGVGAAGSPPVATTGDVMEGMVITNDTNDESSLVGCLADDIEAWPNSYRLPLEQGFNDKVRVFRRLNKIGVIGGVNSVLRLNYFPTEADAQFTRGLCYEPIATDHGMVGPQACTRLHLPGRGEILLYLSHGGHGLQWTDGVTTKPANRDLDWINLIEPTLIHRSILKVYPKLSLVALYYVPAGGTRRTRAFYFSYDPMHLKGDFDLPAFGPITVEAGSADRFLLNGVPRLFTGHGIDGKVYVEDSGTTDDSGGSILPSFRTRRFYANRLGFEGRLERCYILVDAAGNATTGAFTAEVYRQDQGEAVTLAQTNTDGDTVTGGLIELFTDHTLETFDVKISKSVAQTANLGVHHFAYYISYEPNTPDQNPS